MFSPLLALRVVILPLEGYIYIYIFRFEEYNNFRPKVRLVSYRIPLYIRSSSTWDRISRVPRMTLKRLAKSQRPSKARWISLSNRSLEGMSLGEHAAANGNKRTEISCVGQRALIIQWPMDVASGIITRRIPRRRRPPVLFLEMSKRG